MKKRKNQILIFVFAITMLIVNVNVCAEENEKLSQLQSIVITANRFAQQFKNSTADLTIISREDIEKSGAHSLSDVFRSIKGVVVMDQFGNSARVSVDLRGFGETAASNSLVLVDGRRVNQIDLSGVDWTQIPLERIERIEILHGGTGSVLYGDNAVGGVINIITRSGISEKPIIELYTAGGSYNMNKQSFSCDGAKENISYFLTASRFDTNGYRRNSGYHSSDYGAKLEYQINDNITIKLSGNYHEADLGLPGPLNDEEYHTLSKKDSKQKNNDVGEHDYYTNLGLESKIGGTGILNLGFSYRRRWSDTFWGEYSIIDSTLINTFAFTPSYTHNSDLFGRPNKAIFGIDYYKITNTLNSFSSSTGLQTSDNSVDKYSLGFYFSDSFALTDKISFDIGYRYERMRYDFDSTDYLGFFSPINDFEKRKEEAFKGGIVYAWNNATQLFFNSSKSFRSPLTDEFLQYDFNVWPWGRNINKGLGTQRALSFDWGGRHAFNEYCKMTLAFFTMDVDNEIYLDISTYENSNYEKTRRQGINTQFDFRLSRQLSAFINWSYAHSKFLNGQYSGNDIPMVPNNKASAGLNIKLPNNLQAAAVLNYISKRYMISDQANSSGKLNSYITLDLRLSYEKKNYEFFVSINNLLDREYVEYAVTNAFGAKNYYPSPRRNASAGLKIRF